MTSRFDLERDAHTFSVSDKREDLPWNIPTQKTSIDERGYISSTNKNQQNRPQQNNPRLPDESLQQKYKQFSEANEAFEGKMTPQEIQLKIVIAKATIAHFEKLVEIKNDYTIECGKKLSQLEKIIAAHEQLSQETKQGTERAEKVARTIIHLLKQAGSNNGIFPAALTQKSHILTQAVNQLRGSPSLDPQIDAMLSKMSHFDDEISAMEQRIQLEKERYQKSIHEQMLALQAQEVLRKQQQAQQQRFQQAEYEKQLLQRKQQQELESSLSSSTAQKATKEDDLPPRGNASQSKKTTELNEDDLWAVFEEEDNRRLLEAGEIEDELSGAPNPSSSAPNPNQIAPGIIFLTDEESAVLDNAKIERVKKKETTLNQFFDDLEDENIVQERNDDEDIMGKAADLVTTTSSVFSFGNKSAAKKLKQQSGNSSDSDSGGSSPAVSKKSRGVSINVKFGGGKKRSGGSNINSSANNLFSSISSIAASTSNAFSGKDKKSKQSTVQSLRHEKKLDFPTSANTHEILRVVVHSIKMKANANFIGDMDPYVGVSVGKLKKVTGALSKTSDNIWNETLLFADKDIKKLKSPGEIVISVYNYKKGAVKLVTTGDVLGRASVMLEWYAYAPGQQEKLIIVSRSDQKKIASLIVTIERASSKLQVNHVLTRISPWKPPESKQLNLIRDHKHRQAHPRPIEVSGADLDVLGDPLVKAAEMYPSPDLPTVARLIASGECEVNVNYTNFKDQTYLHMMVDAQHVPLVEALAARSNLSALDFNGNTPLHNAVILGNLDIVTILVENGAKTDAKEKYLCTTPLMLAAMYGHPAILKYLLTQNGNADEQDSFGGTPIMKAAAEGHLECVKILVAARCIIDAEDKEGFTALLFAMMNNHVDIVNYLIQNGANISSCSFEGDAPLFIALALGNKQLGSLLAKHLSGTDMRYGRHKQSLVHRAIMHFEEPRALAIIQDLLNFDSDFDIHVKNRMNQNAIFYAAHFGMLSVLNLFKQRNVDVFAKDRAGNTALHFCSNFSTVSFIIEWMSKKVNDQAATQELNHPNINGNTPLHIAYAFGDSEHVRMLITRGVDTQYKNKHGNTPAQMVLCDRSRFLPFYTTDPEAPKSGGILIGRLHTCVDSLIPPV